MDWDFSNTAVEALVGLKVGLCSNQIETIADSLHHVSSL